MVRYIIVSIILLILFYIWFAPASVHTPPEEISAVPLKGLSESSSEGPPEGPPVEPRDYPPEIFSEEVREIVRTLRAPKPDRPTLMAMTLIEQLEAEKYQGLSHNALVDAVWLELHGIMPDWTSYRLGLDMCTDTPHPVTKAVFERLKTAQKPGFGFGHLGWLIYSGTCVEKDELLGRRLIRLAILKLFTGWHYSKSTRRKRPSPFYLENDDRMLQYLDILAFETTGHFIDRSHMFGFEPIEPLSALMPKRLQDIAAWLYEGRLNFSEEGEVIRGDEDDPTNFASAPITALQIYIRAVQFSYDFEEITAVMRQMNAIIRENDGIFDNPLLYSGHNWSEVSYALQRVSEESNDIRGYDLLFCLKLHEIPENDEGSQFRILKARALLGLEHDEERLQELEQLLGPSFVELLMKQLKRDYGRDSLIFYKTILDPAICNY